MILLSADFLAEERSQAHIDLVLAEREKRHLIIVPVVVRSVDWLRSRIGRFYALPRNGKPVASWDWADDAWFDVVEGLRRLIPQRPQEHGYPLRIARLGFSSDDIGGKNASWLKCGSP